MWAPWWLSWLKKKKILLQCKRPGFESELGFESSREDPLEKGKATHSSILAWRVNELYSPWDHKESDTTE